MCLSVQDLPTQFKNVVIIFCIFHFAFPLHTECSERPAFPPLEIKALCVIFSELALELCSIVYKTKLGME